MIQLRHMIPTSLRRNTSEGSNSQTGYIVLCVVSRSRGNTYGTATSKDAYISRPPSVITLSILVRSSQVCRLQKERLE